MNRKLKKIMAGVIGIGLIVLLLAMVNSFVGNPVSRLLAKRAAQHYMDTTRAELHANIESSQYNFKFGYYVVTVQSATSQDTTYSIYVNSFGKVIRDDYEYEVANHFTTYRRLDKGMREFAINQIGSKLDYDIDHISLEFVEEAEIESLTLDMPLDIQNPPLPLMVNVTLYSKDISYSKIAEVGQAVNAILQEQHIPVREYNIRLLPLSDKPQDKHQASSWANSLSVSHYPAERMNEEPLPQAMERFETARDAELNATGKK